CGYVRPSGSSSGAYARVMARCARYSAKHSWRSRSSIGSAPMVHILPAGSDSISGDAHVDDDVAARRVRVRADLVRGTHQRLRLVARQVRHRRDELDLQTEALAGRPDRHVRRDADRSGVELLQPRDVAHRAAEACRVARREQLLWIRAGAARATEALRHGQLDVEVAVV